MSGSARDCDGGESVHDRKCPLWSRLLWFMPRLLPCIQAAFQIADGLEPEPGEFRAGNGASGSGVTVDQNRFGFVQLGHFSGKACSIDVNIESSGNMAFGKLLRTPHVENNSISLMALLFVLRGFNFLKAAFGAGCNRAGFRLLPPGRL